MNRTLVGSLAFLLLVAGLLFGVVAVARNRAVGQGGAEVDKDFVDKDFVDKDFVDKDFPSSISVGSSKPSGDWMKEFTLTERSGKKFHSRDLAGTVHVVNFFFSKCPTMCRTQTSAVAGIAKEFGPQGVKFLSITCDPANDTPAVLSVYAQEFDAHPEQWLFLTGEMPYLKRVGSEMYSLVVDVETHSESLLVVDKWGQVRKRFSWKDGKSIAEMKQYLTELLAETERPSV